MRCGTKGNKRRSWDSPRFSWEGKPELNEVLLLSQPREFQKVSDRRIDSGRLSRCSKTPTVAYRA